MLESAYEACLAFELLERGLRDRASEAVAAHLPRPDGSIVGIGSISSSSGAVVVEVKADRAARAACTRAQLLSYLRLSGCKVGLLINFNVKWLVEDGIKRIVNGFPE